jgi:hypothetical protein
MMEAINEALAELSVDSGVKPTNKESRDDSQPVESPTFLQELTWSLSACNSEVTANLPRGEQVRESVVKAVNGDIKGARNLWKFSVFERGDDITSTGSYDTLREENDQIRRLASWNTINTTNTTGTDGTYGTGVSLATGGSQDEIRTGVDDGDAIDLYWVSNTQQTLKKRKSRRRQRVVKFDYPPIKSIRTCPRPNPEDLPELFFTSIELDQIEDDRYSTISTDDVEIVAMAHKAHHDVASKFSGDNTSSNSQKGVKFADGSPSRHIAMRSSKERPSTPLPRRNDGDNDSQISSAMPPKSPQRKERLVNGVQIYLRERSTERKANLSPHF